jgi:hypothetical protein
MAYRPFWTRTFVQKKNMGTESLTRSLLGGKEENLIASFPLLSIIQWSACWALPTRSTDKNGEGYYSKNLNHLSHHNVMA